jgi:signal transduction histidine kinase/CheY-like chemotaxis protein
MLDMSRTALRPMLERLRNWHFSRPQMLGIALFVIGADSLFFSVLVDLPYDHRPNLWLGVILLAAIPFVRWRAAFAYLVTLMLGSGLFVITYLAMHSGGINSPTLVWIAVMPMLALLLMGRKTTFVWMGLTLIAYFSLYMACKSGWIASVNPHTAHDVWWAFLNHAFAAAGLIMGVQMYDYLHKQQMDLLDRRNGELMATHESMRQAQAHKDEFLAAVGHELRTPMNAILGFNGVLRDQVARDPEQVEIVDHIRRATQQLLGLVNDILDFSQLQAGRMLLNPQACDVPHVLRQLAPTYAARAQAKGLAWDMRLPVDFPARVMLDAQKFQQVVRNLLDNALKFTAEGQVQLALTMTPGALRLEVQDTGKGIAKNRQQQIFTRFEQADIQTNRTYGGTGLGLAICDGLVRLAGGRIGVHSDEGQGALFWFEWPVTVLAGDAQTQAAQELPADAALQILLIDDNRVNLMVAQLQLKKRWPQAQITAFDNAGEALQKLQDTAFDLALVDMIMPDMDGLEFTRQARAHPQARIARMPVLALTANSHSMDRERCLLAGMDEVLVKPMDEANMAEKVAQLVCRAHPEKWA